MLHLRHAETLNETVEVLGRKFWKVRNSKWHISKNFITVNCYFAMKSDSYKQKP